MSSYESDTEWYTDMDTDADTDTVGSEVTYTSLEAALADMTSRIAEIDEGLHTMTAAARVLEQPFTSVAISSFTNPRVLESAPFRSQSLEVKPDYATILNIQTSSSLKDACAAIRHTLRQGGDVLGSRNFLDILQHLIVAPGKN